MAGNIFQDVKSALQPRLPEVLADLLPGGKVDGKEYVCASLEGGAGHSCKTNIETGKGSDFATGESWGDVIALAAVCLGKRQIEAARELAHRYGIAVDDGRQRYDTPREKTRPVQPANQPTVEQAADTTCTVPLKATSLAVTGDNQATPEEETFDLKAWPKLSADAYPGLLGEFVRLATRDSEADPAAVCATTLVRFCGEIYGHAANQGPYIMVGETRHPPRLFAVICGNTSKARKGTSRHPVTKLFDINGRPPNLAAMPAPAKISNGPLSSGEGLAFNVRELTDEEWEKLEKSPSMAGRNRDDKRLVILDEEFASALSCMKREGNTLSMSIRCFWDSGEYAPLTKSNPVTVKGAHINILSHITMQELAVALEEVQVVNGFGNRFLWICARRSKLVPLPSPMPDNELVRLQSAFWERVAFAQKQGRMTMTPDAIRLWQGAYPDLSKEHAGFVGNIVNRAEAQTLRLALVYALLDGSDKINPMHLHSALCMWHYAEASALYIFGDKPVNPLETKILEFLKNGPLTATELSKALSGHVPSETLQPVLQQLETQQRITIEKLKTGGRAKVVISLRSLTEASEKRENGEKSGVAA